MAHRQSPHKSTPDTQPHQQGVEQAHGTTPESTDAGSPAELLSRAVELYRSLVDGHTEFIVRWLPDGTRTFVNQSYCRYMGKSPAELIGTSLYPTIHEDHRDQFRKRIASLHPRSPSSTGQHCVVLADESVVWHEWTDCALFDPQGNVVELQSVGRDISEQKRAELALRQSEERFQRAFHASPIGITLTSTQDNRLVDVNQGWERIMGFSRSEALGKTSLELGTWRNPRDRDALLRRLKAGEEVRQVEIEYVTKSGEYGVCEVSIGGFIASGGNRTFVTAMQDITARKQVEKDLRKALEEVKQLTDQLEAENIYLRQEMEQESSFGDLIGQTEAFRANVRSIELVAPTDATVLIVGESGTGKELVAREIHRRSSRSRQPLIRVNCAAISRELYESEFFGHVKGAFTGALRDHAGRFELADGGTILLDEITEIPLEMQSKLLRVLQEGEYQRVGGETTCTTNVRVIATTNRDLKLEIAENRFREDLYYRLSVFPIEVVPLRNRRHDIPLLAQHFLKIICKRMNRAVLGISSACVEQLQAYDWPGNVRELQNIIERGIITSNGRMLKLDFPGGKSGRPFSGTAEVARDRGIVTQAEMKQYERHNIIAALERSDWHVFGPRGAAALLDIKPTTLASRIRKMGISKPTDG